MKLTKEHIKNLALSKIGKRGNPRAGRPSCLEEVRATEARKRVGLPITGKSYKEYLKEASARESYYGYVLENYNFVLEREYFFRRK